MTLCLAFTTSDGIVLATDSTALVQSSLVPTTAYENAEKLFQLVNLPVAVMAYGVGTLGSRTFGSLVSEWNEDNLASYARTRYTVEQVATDLTEWLLRKHSESMTRAEAELSEVDPAAKFDRKRFKIGVVVAGYQPGKGPPSFFPHLYECDSDSPELKCVRPHDDSDGPEPGVDSWGITGVPERLLHGVDRRLLQEILASHNVTLSLEDGETLTRFVWPVAWGGMPLQDAVDLTEFVMNAAIGYERFRAGISFIGGEPEILVINRTKLQWIRRKALSAAMAPATS